MSVREKLASEIEVEREDTARHVARLTALLELSDIVEQFEQEHSAVETFEELFDNARRERDGFRLALLDSLAARIASGPQPLGTEESWEDA